MQRWCFTFLKYIAECMVCEYALFEIFRSDLQVGKRDILACSGHNWFVGRLYFFNKYCVMNIQTISDGQLYEMCRKFGREALLARNKFIGLLPEVNARRLYETKKFVSLFHFAAVIAGVSKEQVRLVINLDNRFENMPQLRGILVEGLASVNKLSRVVSIATVENQVELAEKVLILSKAALDVFVRDYLIKKNRIAQSAQLNNEIEEGLFTNQNTDAASGQNQDGFPKPETEAKCLPGQIDDSINSTKPAQLITYIKTPILGDEVKKQLNELQEKGINIDQIILEALEKRKKDLEQRTAVQVEKAEQKLIEQIVEGKPISHYIPVATERLLKDEHGEMCSIPFCKNIAKVIHHTNRFSISHSHDPRYLAPLCDPHHQIAHAVDVKASEMRRNKMRE